MSYLVKESLDKIEEIEETEMEIREKAKLLLSEYKKLYRALVNSEQKRHSSENTYALFLALDSAMRCIEELVEEDN